MKRNAPAWLSAVATALLLAACGGSDGDDESAQLTSEERYAALSAEAGAARAEVVANAASGPCSSDAQCSTLNLTVYQTGCPSYVETVDYSLASATASAASAAAARYQAAASQAQALAPPLPPGTHASCTTWSQVPLPQICENGSCTRGLRFTTSPS